MITVQVAKNALEKLEKLEKLEGYHEFMTTSVRAILLAKLLNDEVQNEKMDR